MHFVKLKNSEEQRAEFQMNLINLDHVIKVLPIPLKSGERINVTFIDGSQSQFACSLSELESAIRKNVKG